MPAMLPVMPSLSGKQESSPPPSAPLLAAVPGVEELLQAKSAATTIVSGAMGRPVRVMGRQSIQPTSGPVSDGCRRHAREPTG